MAFANNNDVYKYAPEVFDSGVDDWSAEIALAESDVINNIRANYWNKFHSPGNFDSAKLTETQWTKATVYKALSSYILPKLSTFRPEGDPFMMQLSFYKERFAEEMDMQFGIGIEYDTDNSGTVTEGEIDRYTQDRLYR